MILEPFKTNRLQLSSRVVMAPITRCMAGEAQEPTEEMVAYYARRSSVGLVIAEATCISPCANAYPGTPGIYTDQQVAAWRKVTDGVHENGGKIYLQLWHAGMMGHRAFRGGELPLSPSGVAPLRKKVPRTELVYEAPRVMEKCDFAFVLELFIEAARRAKEAGFDGVELHGASGYLLDSFLHHHTNRRRDIYGEQKERFVLNVVDAVSQVLPTGLRLSPGPLAGMENMRYDARDLEVFKALFEALNDRDLAYLHLAVIEDQPFVRAHYHGTLIGCGGYTPQSASHAVSAGHVDLVAFGRLMVANPDLVSKVRKTRSLAPFGYEMLSSPP